MLNPAHVDEEVLNMQDLFARGRWQQIIFLTYSFDLPFFESYLLPILIQGGCRSITVVADAEWLAEHIPTWQQRNQIRDAGQRYLLCGAKVPGAFHPKLVLAVNKTGGSLLVGSGNISAFGMATGGELFTSVTWQDQPAPSLAAEIWSFCLSLSQHLSLDAHFVARLHEMANLARGLRLASTQQHLLYHNLDEALLPQLVRAINGQKVQSLLLWSPFTDHDLKALRQLISQLQPQCVIMALQEQITNIDGSRLQSLVNEFSSITWNFFELEQDSSTKKQMIHAKGILVTLSSGEEILFAGSPNLSAPALLRTIEHGNMEVALLIKGKSIQDQLFHNGPVKLAQHEIDLASFSWRPEFFAGPQAKPHIEVVLLSATQEDAQITLKAHTSCPLTAQVLLDSSDDLLPIMHQDGALVVRVPTDTPPRTIQLTWDGGESNVIIITHLKPLRELVQEREHKVSFVSLLNGSDSEWTMFLDLLAETSIIDAYDLIRTMQGLPLPDLQQEAWAAEHPLLPEDIESIDFKAAMQHYLQSHPHVSGLGGLPGVLSSPRFEGIREFFDFLSKQQQQRAVQPEINENSEDALLDVASANSPVPLTQPVPLGKKIRMRLRHCIRRFINGLRMPAFCQNMAVARMTTNYISLLDLLDKIWRLQQTTGVVVLTLNEYTSFCHDALSAFWGSDLETGYWELLTENQTIEVGCILIDSKADVLTLIIASRLLNKASDICRIAPFVIAHIMKCADSLDLFTYETSGTALTYLDQPECDPALFLKQLKDTQLYFTWPRYSQVLAKKYQLRKASFKDRGFSQGLTLVVDADKDLFTHPSALSVLIDWMQVSAIHEPDRKIFQMLWGEHEEWLIYNINQGRLSCRQSDKKPSTLCNGTPLSELTTWPPDKLAELLHENK